MFGFRSLTDDYAALSEISLKLLYHAAFGENGTVAALTRQLIGHERRQLLQKRQPLRDASLPFRLLRTAVAAGRSEAAFAVAQELRLLPALCTAL